MRKSWKKIVAMATASVLAMAAAVTVMPNTADAAVSKTAKKAAKAEFDPAGTYHAYFGLQQETTWIFRDPWYSEELGLEGTKYDDSTDASFSDILRSNTEGLEKQSGTVTDAEITGNGVYSVGVEGLDGCLTMDQAAKVTMLYVNTDIPVAAKDTITISDVKLELDGTALTLPEEVFFNVEDETATGLLRFDPYNSYQRDQGAYPNCPGSVLNPNDSIKITFTVSGMANDNPDAVEETPAPKDDAADSSAAETDDEKSEGGVSAPLIAGVVVGVVFVAGVVVIVTKKKK